MAIYYATDANDQLIYTLDESASPWANTGAAGALNLTVQSAGPTVVAGLYSNGVNMPGPNASTKYLTSGAAGTTVGEISTNLTVSGWVFPTSLTGYGNMVCKAYRPDASGWTTPFESIWLGLNNTNDGQILFLITVGAASVKSFVSGSIRVTVSKWNHIGLTYDGTTLRGYINGVAAGTLASSGSMDYGTHGPWTLGGEVSGADSLNNGIIDDVRVANVVRSVDWFSNVAANGLSTPRLGLYEQLDTSNSPFFTGNPPLSLPLSSLGTSLKDASKSPRPATLGAAGAPPIGLNNGLVE